MKFKNLMNPIAPENTEMNLSEKEIEFLAMLKLCVNQFKINDLLSVSEADFNVLCEKFGTTNPHFDQKTQLITICLINNIITNDILQKVYDKYNLLECKEMLETLLNSPEYDKEYFTGISEQLSKIHDILNN